MSLHPTALAEPCEEEGCLLCVTDRGQFEQNLRKAAAGFIRHIEGGIEIYDDDNDTWRFVSEGTEITITTDSEPDPKPIPYKVLSWVADIANQPLLVDDLDLL